MAYIVHDEYIEGATCTNPDFDFKIFFDLEALVTKLHIFPTEEKRMYATKQIKNMKWKNFTDPIIVPKMELHHQWTCCQGEEKGE